MKNQLIRSLALLLVLCASCSKQAPIPSAREVKELTQKVADWQINTFEEQGKYRALPPKADRKPWHHRDRYNDLEWIPAAFYAGLYEFSTIANDGKYVDFLSEIGIQNRWKLHERMYHADDHAVGMTYIKLAEYYAHNMMLNPTRNQFDQIMNGDKADVWHWTWCDALFMAPPVWSELSKATGDIKYLNYMDKQYRMTYDKLYNKEAKLFYRDASYIDQTEKNGEKIFWSRGNGWVFGGLAYLIPDIPADWAGRSFYTQLFQEMAEAVIASQRPDGTWSAGMLGDVADYPNIETSGTGFFTFGLAWGINNGLLDRATYEEPLLRAWNALAGTVNEEGMVGYVQPVGAAPGLSFENYTELYGSGAFLAAGTEMVKFIQQFYPEEQKYSEVVKVADTKLFMEDGGWCWYQGPRAIINNGKLIVGAVEGVHGDVRVGVYDLDKDTIVGSTVLDPRFQADDHNAPALYARPDGSILAMWARHAVEKMHYYKISSPTNYLEWSDKMTFDHGYDNPNGVTYMNLYYMKDEAKLYSFFRDGPTYNPTYITSDDHGKTWGNRTHLIANEVSGRNRPYAIYDQMDENTVGISYTDAHPRDYGNSLYYVEFRNGVFYNADGSKIQSIKDGPLLTTHGEKLYKGSETRKKPSGFESVPNSAWTCAMEMDADKHPHIGYTLYLNNNDHRFRLATWDGEKWNDREIAYAGRCLYYIESSYTGLLTIDPTDPSMVYISTDVNPSTGEYNGGTHEIYAARIGADDDIKSIEWQPITSGSTQRNIRPIVVAKDGYKALLWLHGNWRHFCGYDVDVVGKILERPAK